MKIALTITYLIVFNISQGQIVEKMKLENDDNLHFFEVIEPVMKNVLFEKFIGQNIEIHNSDIQQECLNRLKNRYTDKEIEALKNNVPEKYILPFKSRTEILIELIEFVRDTFNPELKKVQNEVYSLITKEEQKQITELKVQYKNAINLNFEQKKNELLTHEDMDVKVKNREIGILKLEYELSIISPDLRAVWKINGQESQMLDEFSKKYDYVITNTEIDYVELVKGRFMINIGRLGNIASAVMGFVENKKEIETLITREVLLIN